MRSSAAVEPEIRCVDGNMSEAGEKYIDELMQHFQNCLLVHKDKHCR
jgi:hypothetical protein